MFCMKKMFFMSLLTCLLAEKCLALIVWTVSAHRKNYSMWSERDRCTLNDRGKRWRHRQPLMGWLQTWLSWSHVHWVSFQLHQKNGVKWQVFWIERFGWNRQSDTLIHTKGRYTVWGCSPYEVMRRKHKWIHCPPFFLLVLKIPVINQVSHFWSGRWIPTTLRQSAPTPHPSLRDHVRFSD